MADILLQADADINMQNRDGDSALHLAVKGNHVNTVKTLVKYSPVRCRNKEDKTALDLAKVLSHNDIVIVLEDYMKAQEGEQAAALAKSKQTSHVSH